MCVVLEATLASPIEPGYGVPLAPVISPIQTVTLPQGPALLTAPTTIRVVAHHAPAQFVHQLPLTTQFVHQSAPQFIQTVAGPFAPELQAAHVQAPLAFAAPVQAPLAFAAPVPALPVVGATAVQHHAQDEFGAFNYGYQVCFYFHIQCVCMRERERERSALLKGHIKSDQLYFSF